jgi:hypothetical protein
MLYYVYQKQRENGEGVIQLMEADEKEWEAVFHRFPFPAAALPRLLFGEKGEKRVEHSVWFSPLWDLLEIIKILE